MLTVAVRVRSEFAPSRGVGVGIDLGRLRHVLGSELRRLVAFGPCASELIDLDGRRTGSKCDVDADRCTVEALDRQRGPVVEVGDQLAEDLDHTWSRPGDGTRHETGEVNLGEGGAVHELREVEEVDGVRRQPEAVPSNSDIDCSGQMIAEVAVLLEGSAPTVHEGRDSRPVECGGDVDEIRDGLEEDLLEDHRLDGMPLEDRVHDHPTLRRRLATTTRSNDALDVGRARSRLN